MSTITDVLAAHRYRPEDRSCSCDENWYDSRFDRSGDLEEHFLHVEKELIDAGIGSVAEAKSQALEEAANALDGEAADSLYTVRNRELSLPYSKPMNPEGSAELDGIEASSRLLRERAAQEQEKCSA